MIDPFNQRHHHLTLGATSIVTHPPATGRFYELGKLINQLAEENDEVDTQCLRTPPGPDSDALTERMRHIHERIDEIQYDILKGHAVTLADCMSKLAAALNMIDIAMSSEEDYDSLDRLKASQAGIAATLIRLSKETGVPVDEVSWAGTIEFCARQLDDDHE